VILGVGKRRRWAVRRKMTGKFFVENRREDRHSRFDRR